MPQLPLLDTLRLAFGLPRRQRIALRASPAFTAWDEVLYAACPHYW